MCYIIFVESTEANLIVIFCIVFFARFICFCFKKFRYKNKDNKSILDSFIQAKENKKKFSSLFIKSSLFIFNKDVNQTSTKEDIEKAKNDIQSLIKGIDKNNINMFFFNTKYFIYLYSYYYYIYNLDKTLQFEYENYNYNNNKYNFFMKPFSNNNIINESFGWIFSNLKGEK